MDKDIYRKLCKIHKKYVARRKVTNETCLFEIWPTDDPPDELEGTPQLEDIEEAVGITIEEEDAVKIYDMNFKDASEYIKKLVNCQLKT